MLALLTASHRTNERSETTISGLKKVIAEQKAKIDSKQ